MKRVFKILIIWLVFNASVVYAEEFNITSKYVILYNLNDQDVLYELDSEEKTQIASLTKIMTVIVAIEQSSDLDEIVEVPKEAFDGISEYSQVGLKIGDQVTVRDLLYGAMLPSGADAVNALAIHISGSVSKFVELMNEKVEELKLKNTHFDNPIGMDSEDNYSTAKDVATMLIYALDNDTFKEIFTARNYTITSLNIPMKSTLIGYSSAYGLDVSEITGAKSGFTDGAGLCLASSATIDDVNYLLVTMGAETKNRSNAVRDTLEIYNYYSSTYSYQQVMQKDQVLATIPVKWGKIKNYEIKAVEDEYLYLENGIRKNKIKYQYNGIEELKYNIKKGTKLGTVTIVYRNEELKTYDVYLNDTIEYYHPVLYGLIILAVILMICSLKMMKNKGKKKHSKSKKKGKKKVK